jgi:hypothetical protein
MPIVCSIYAVKSSAFFLHLFLVLPCPESHSLTRDTTWVLWWHQTLILLSHIAQHSLLHPPSVLMNHRWYTLGTIPTHRPKPVEGFQRISVKLQKSQQLSAYRKPTTLCLYKLDNILLSILPHQTVTMPGVLYLLCSLIIFKIIPYPMTLLIVFPLQVIISYLILYCLLSLPHCHITYLLPSSHIPSPCVCPTRHLNPFS